MLSKGTFILPTVAAPLYSMLNPTDFRHFPSVVCRCRRAVQKVLWSDCANDCPQPQPLPRSKLNFKFNFDLAWQTKLTLYEQMACVATVKAGQSIRKPENQHMG